MSWNRITYYSKYDGAGFCYLEKAKEILICFDEKNVYTINDLIEFYQIKLYLDNEVFLAIWTQEEIEKYKSISKKMWTVIVRFWQKINDSNLIELFESLECWTVQDSFWELTNNLSAYKQFNNETFCSLITTHEVNVRAILHQEKIVSYYMHELRDFLLKYEKTAELILTQYVEKHDRELSILYFPKCLSLIDKEAIISRYLDDKEANLNYVRLVLNIKKQTQLDISDTTRLKAKRLEKRLNEEIYQTIEGVRMGIEISFNDDQDLPMEYSLKNKVQYFSYGTKYIFLIDHPVVYLNHFNTLFNYLDEQFCVSMVSYDSDFDTFEKIFMKSKHEYPTGFIFNRKDFLSLGQIFLYDNVLVKAQKYNIEQLIRYFVVEHLEKSFHLKGFRFKLPSNGTSYLEKIRLLLAEFDAFLRQYKLYFENSEIDHELLQMSSNAYNFTQIPSFVTKKYCYTKSDYFNIPFKLLFSDQSGLFYVEPFKNKGYHCLYDLILKENVSLENFEVFQLQGINFLIEKGYLKVDDNGFVKFKNNGEIIIIKQLYKKKVLSYWHCSKNLRDIIDDFVNKDILEFKDTLFNKSECDYFNYYLNKKEFTNGLDLRNSFLHGTNPDSESELKNLYYILLRIIVLAILKVNDDQILKLLNVSTGAVL